MVALGEVWTPSRMLLANVNGDHKVAAIEFAAVRDPGRKMKLRTLLGGMLYAFTVLVLKQFC